MRYRAPKRKLKRGLNIQQSMERQALNLFGYSDGQPNFCLFVPQFAHQLQKFVTLFLTLANFIVVVIEEDRLVSALSPVLSWDSHALPVSD